MGKIGNNLLALYGWAVNGFVSGAEERSQSYSVEHNARTIANQRAYYDAVFVDGIAGSDTTYGGNPRFIRADTVVGREERHWYEKYGVNEAPVQNWGPSMAQLSKAIYDNINELWQQIAEDEATGRWGEMP